MGGKGGFCLGLVRGLTVLGLVKPTPLSSLQTVWAADPGKRSLNRLYPTVEGSCRKKEPEESDWFSLMEW